MNDHTFQPIATLTPQPDGTYALEIDWADSYIGRFDEDSGWYEFADNDEEREAEDLALAAIDHWVKAHAETTFTLHAVDRTATTDKEN